MKKYSYDKNTLGRFRFRIYISAMSVPRDFFRTPVADLQKCCNGVGPARWHRITRRIFSGLLHFLNEAAVIHDWEFTYQPKTYFHFTKANLRLVFNAAMRGHPVSGLAAGVLCQLFGWQEYQKVNF